MNTVFLNDDVTIEFVYAADDDLSQEGQKMEIVVSEEISPDTIEQTDADAELCAPQRTVRNIDFNLWDIVDVNDGGILKVLAIANTLRMPKAQALGIPKGLQMAKSLRMPEALRMPKALGIRKALGAMTLTDWIKKMFLRSRVNRHLLVMLLMYLLVFEAIFKKLCFGLEESRRMHLQSPSDTESTRKKFVVCSQQMISLTISRKRKTRRCNWR